MSLTLLEHLMYNHQAFSRKYYYNQKIKPGEIHTLPMDMYMAHARIGKHDALTIYVANRMPDLYNRPDSTYHCLFHALEVATMAYFDCFQAIGSEKEALKAYIAGVFHDADYMVGRDDGLNVVAAVGAFRRELQYMNPLVKVMAYHDINKVDIENIITCTQFDKTTGTFPLKPHCVAAEAVRDADLLGFTSCSWPSLLSGLAVEMGVDPNSWIEIKDFLTRQYNFLSNQKMFIDSGKSETQLRVYLTALRVVLNEL